MSSVSYKVVQNKQLPPCLGISLGFQIGQHWETEGLSRWMSGAGCSESLFDVIHKKELKDKKQRHSETECVEHREAFGLQVYLYML